MDVRSPLYQAIARALLAILILDPLVATAGQLTVDQAAGGNTSLGAAGNGVPVVNIATPNGSGLSHNKFTDYNVDQQGLILNNSTNKTQSTQLGGIILGNSNLHGQAATRILNEVTGGSPSQLQGYTEVAGQGAHVIVANPNGITCDGCGFINTPRATLTTGKPILDGQRLQGYDVDGGEIAIQGAGLNASNIDRFELITRSAKLNADLHANRLDVVAGRNQVDAETLAATAKADDGSSKPTLAIDSSSLGGMYAGAIRLVGTEAGVGVRLDGNMAASAGDIRLDANGKLELAQASANGNLELKGQDVALGGPAYATGSANVQASGTLSNAQSLAAGTAIVLDAAQIANNGVIEAGVNADNSRNSQGDVSFQAQGVRNAGTVVASRSLQASVGGLLDNQGGTLKGDSTALAANAIDNRQGRLLASMQLSLATAQQLDNRNGQAEATRLQLDGGALDNRLGLLSADQTLAFNLATLDNSSKGTLVSNGELRASISQQLDNHDGGLLSAKGLLDLHAAAVDNRAGLLVSDAGLSLVGGSLDNSAQGIVSGKDLLQLDLDRLDNSQGGTLNSDAGLQLRANQVNNASLGLIAAKGDLQANLGSLAQQGGQLLSQGALSLDVNQLDNRNGGLLAANQGVTLHGRDLLNQGGEVSSRAKVTITADSLDNSAGKVVGDGGLNLEVQQLANRQGALAGRDGLSLRGQSLDNSQGGLLSSQSGIWLQLGGALDNHGQGAVLSQGTLDLSAASLDNSDGTLSSAGAFFTRLGGILNNQGGRLLSDAGIDLAAGGDLDNSAGGVLSAAGDIHLQTAKLDNSQAGRIVTDAGISLDSAQLDNSLGGSLSALGAIGGRVTGLDQHDGGQLVSQAGIDLDLQGGALNNATNGLIATPGQLQLRNAGRIDNQSGEISSASAFSLATGDLFNQGGKILSADRLQLQGAVLNNSQGGVLSGSNGLSLDAASLDNSTGGTLASRGDLLAHVQGALDNRGDGALVASGALDVGAGSLDNQGGLLSANGDLKLSSGASDNRNGRIIAQGRLDASTDNLDNRDGVLSSAQGLGLRAADIRNGTSTAGLPGGLITSQGDLALYAGQFEAVNGGEVSAKGNLQLTVARLIQQQAKLIGEGNVRLDLGSAGQPGDFDNRGSLLSAAGTLQLNNLGNLDNRGGEISSVQGFTLGAAGTLDNGDQGRIISAGQLNLTATALRNANQGLLSGWQGLAVSAASLDNSAGGTLSSRNGPLGVSLSGALDNHDQGALVSQNNLTLAADSLNNANGILSTLGDLSLALAGDLDNRNGGLLSAQGQLTGSGQALDNRGGQISANGIQLDASSLDNSSGSLASQGALRLGLLGTLLNLGPNAKLASAGPLNLSAGNVDNRGGQLVSQSLLKVLAGRFDNSAGGTVASQDALTLGLSGALLNGQHGLLYSKAGNLDLSATSLDNAGGTLQGQGDTTLRIQDSAGNQGGRIISQAGNLDLQSASLNNSSGGILSSAVGWLKLVTGWFGNNTGTTQAQSLDVQATGGIDNRSGYLSAVSGANQVVTTDLDNRGGGLYAGGLLSFSGNQLFNQGGKIGADGLDVGLAGALSNQAGLIESSAGVSLGAASIDNQSGAIRALGQAPSDLMRIASAGLLNNSLGRIESATQDFSLQSGSLQNAGGSVLHVGGGIFGIDLAQAGLAGGSFTSNGSLSYQAASLINNSVIQAGNLNLNIGQLSQGSSGQLLAAQSFTGNGGNWSNDGLIASDGSLGLTLSGSYSGNGRLTSLGALDLVTGSIGLGAPASIAGGGTTTVSSGGTLDNSGHLTSAAGLQVSAATLNNYGTLGSAGNLRLAAGNLLNQNGLIFSGGDMTLRIDNLTNRYADVYSLGALDLAADDAGGRTARLDNLSGSLESQGDMSLNVATLNNQRVVLVVNNAGKYTAKIVEVNCYKYLNDTIADCSGGKDNHVWEITERDKLDVLQASAGSSISAGGNLSISGDLLNNASSVISAGQNLYASVGSLTNQGVVTGETETFRVFRSARTRDPSSWRNEAVAFTDKYWYESPNYVNDPSGLATDLSHFISTTEFELAQYGTQTSLGSDSQIYAGIIQAAGNLSIIASDQINNSVIRNNYTYINPGQKTGDTAVGASPVSTVMPINAQLPPALAQQQVNPIALPGFSLPQGQSGLFRLSGQAGSGASTGSVQGAGELTFAGQNIGAVPREQALGSSAVQSGNVTLGSSVSAGDAQSGAGLSIARVQGLPSSATPSNSHKYLIESNPELTSLKSFLSSDYLLDQLGYDPDQTQKRLGDGLYEQRLLQQAVVARTGQRYIDGMTSDESLFKYLMDNAIAYKDELHLTPGVALSAEQVAALTHDIVWLEEAEVNGEKVLVPVLYLAQANNRLAPNGALIQGHDLNLISGGGLANQGVLRASNNLDVTANSIDNNGLIEANQRLQLLATDSIRNAMGGLIAGRDVRLTALNGDVINERSVTHIDSAQGNRRWTASFADSAARIEAANDLSISAGRDASNIGGVLKAGNDLSLSAGRDVNFTSVQLINGQVNGKRYAGQTISQLGADVSAGRDLAISAGRDLTSVASRLDAARDAALSAGRDVTLASAADETHSYSHTKKVTAQEDHVQQQSTTLNAGGDVLVSAGDNLTLKAGKVSAGNEAYLYASRDVSLEAAENSDYSYYRKTQTSHSALSSSTKTRIDSSSSTTQDGSLVSADKIAIRSGQDIGVTASDVASTSATSLSAGRNITVDGALETLETSHAKWKQKTGLMSSGGLGFSIGSASNKYTSTTSTQNTKGSTIGSVLGSVDMQADKDLTIKGSDVIAGKDINLIGQNVSILANENHNNSEQIYKSKQSGLTVALSGTVGSAIDATYQTAKQAKQEDDSRLSALQGIKAGLTGVQAWQAAQQNGGMNGDNVGQFFGISASLGSQKFSSKQTQEQAVSQGSNVTAGNNLNILATGSGQTGTDGDIRVQGSQLKAGQDLLLAANRDIGLESAANAQKLSGKNSSSGWSVGASMGIGKGGGLSVFANLNLGSGKEKGNGTTWSETTLDAAQQVSLISGRDTSLKGAQANGEQVIAKVGRDLLLQSQQDTDYYDSKQMNLSAGGSMTVLGPGGGSANFSASQSKIDSNYRSVQEQTGLFSGKGGFQIDVGNHTQLDASVIASTADADKNRLSTATLGWSAVDNKADYKSQQRSVSVSSGNDGSGIFNTNLPSGMLIAYNHGGSASGTTSAATSAGALDIRDPANQKQDVATLSHDAEHANGSISPIFDKEKEQKRLQQVQLIGEIGTQAMDIVRTQGQLNAEDAGRKELAKKGNESPSQAEIEASDAYKAAMKSYGTGSNIQRAAQAVTAALQGLAGGDIGSALAGAAAPYLAQLIKQSTGDDRELNMMAHAVLGAVVAQVQGNSAAAGAAGGAVGELAAQLVTEQLYGVNDPSKLTEEQKQTVSALSSLAGGFAGGLVKGDTASALAGASAGKNAVENNYLGTGLNFFGHQLGDNQVAEFRGELKASCGGSGGMQACLDTYEKWKETSYKQGGLETEADKASWEEFVHAAYAEYALPLCKGNPTCEGQVRAKMAADMVEYAGDAVGLKDSIGSVTRAVNLANENTLETGLQLVEDITLLGSIGSAAGVLARASANAATGELPPLRQAYVNEVKGLEDVALNMRAAGASPEQVARQLHQMRRDLGVRYKGLTPEPQLEAIYARNLEKYGDKLGPTVEWLRAKGKSWEQIIESASRSGGKDLGF